MSGRGKRAKWTAKQKLRMASINGTGATLEPHQVKDVYEAVLTKDAAEKAVLDRLRNLPDDVASYIAQKHCFSYEVAKIVGKDLASAIADAMEANNGH